MSAEHSLHGDPQQLLAEAMRRHRGGDLEHAAGLYERLLALEPGHQQALRLAGALARERGRRPESIALLLRACDASPSDAAARNELALSYLASGNLPAAEAALRAALERDPDSVRAWANLGALLQFRGRLHAAAECHREVLRRRPEDLEVRCNLASTLVDAGRGEEALQECDTALELAPGHPSLLAAKGAVLLSQARPDAALDYLRLATGRQPEDDMALVNLAQACRQQGLHGEARAALRRACEQNPDNARAAADYANLLGTGGQTAAALRLCAEFLERHPGERMVLASQALALRDAGQATAARRLVDHDNLIRVSQLPIPAGFADAPAFRAALLAAILEDDSLLAEPASKATRGGRQTGELNLRASPALAALAEILDSAVRDTIDCWRGAGYQDHPALACDTGNWSLRVWATVLDAGGRQLPHHHPLGLLSGVCYLQVPPGEGDDAQAGWLEFGLPPERLDWSVTPETRSIEPEPGRLVLFPSYFWHRTLPFAAVQSRVSIAFDAVPTAG